MSIVHSLKTRASACATCPFLDGTTREAMERIAGMSMETLIRRDGVVCHEEMFGPTGALVQCPAAGPWLARKASAK